MVSERVQSWLDEFVKQPPVTLEARQPVHAADPARSVHPQAVCSARESFATQELLRLVLADDSALALCTNPSAVSLPKAMELALRLNVLDPAIDARLLHLLLPRSGPAIRETWHATRLLEIVETISDGSRTHPVLVQLLWHSDPRVRSKAALLIGRFHPDVAWLEQQLSNEDPRVRANATESMWGVSSAQVIALFRRASNDKHHRVVANAIVGLHRAGELESIEIIQSMSGHAEPLHRAAAVWAMGETADPRFLLPLGNMRGEADALVRRNVFRSTVRIRKHLEALKAQDPLLLSVICYDHHLLVRVTRPDELALPVLPATAFVVTAEGRSLALKNAHCMGGDCPDLAQHQADYEIILAESAPPEFRVEVYTPTTMGEGAFTALQTTSMEPDLPPLPAPTKPTAAPPPPQPSQAQPQPESKPPSAPPSIKIPQPSEPPCPKQNPPAQSPSEPDLEQAVKGGEAEAVDVPTYTGTVIIITEKSALMLSLINLLRAMGITVIVARKYSNLVNEATVTGGLIDLVICEPDGTEWETISAYEDLRHYQPDVKILFIGGYGYSKTLQRCCMGRRRARILRRPFTSSAMIAVIVDAIKEQ